MFLSVFRRKLADKVAAAGFIVVVPDLCYGDSYDSQKYSSFQQWLPNHQPDGKPLEDSKKLATILSAKGVSQLGISGFCWGGKVAIAFAKECCCNAVALCHPSFVTIDDIRDCAAPLAILAAENDRMTPPELLDGFKDHFQHIKKDYFVKVYLGTAHGWTCRYDEENESDVHKAEEAHRDLIAWFQKHL